MIRIKKSRLLLTFMLISVLILSACGTAQDNNPNATGSNSTPSEYNPNTPAPEDQSKEGTPQADEESKVDEQEQLTLTFYYVDEELLGLKEKEKTISYATEEELWTALWEELQDSGEEGFVSLWENFELLEITVEEGILTLNLAKPENLSFGSTAEGFAIQTLLQTVGQIEGIEAIQILIDGEVEESLAGHVSIDQPIEVNDTIYTGQ